MRQPEADDLEDAAMRQGWIMTVQPPIPPLSAYSSSMYYFHARKSCRIRTSLGDGKYRVNFQIVHLIVTSSDYWQARAELVRQAVAVGKGEEPWKS